MARKTLLFLSAAHCHACTWQNGELSAEACFADNVEGKEQFTAFLQANHSPALLLTDLIEEDFRHETVPHLRGRERAALIRRKLEQYYRDTPFRQAATLQRRKDGRRDDDMLFSALTNPALISPWLNIMLTLNIPLSGIYSIPNICAPLVKGTPSANLLLLSWEKHAGLRQTYFYAKLLRFSRLTPMHANDSFGATAAAETARTQQYLRNLSLLPPGSTLDVYIICHANDRRELESQLNDDPDMRYAYLDIQELSKRVGLKTAHAGSDATPLFLHLLAAQPPHSHYAAAEHTRFFRLLQIRHALLGLSAALAAGSLLYAAANIREYMKLEQESQLLNAKASQLWQQARQITQKFPATLASATDMKTAVILSRNLDSISPPPQIILNALSKTLDRFPTIHINRLSWQANPAASGTAPVTALHVDAIAVAPTQVVLLNGELAEFTGNYRGALDELERFRQALIQHGYEVTALSLPLDTSPQGSIAADSADSANKPAQFSLKISWKTAA